MCKGLQNSFFEMWNEKQILNVSKKKLSKKKNSVSSIIDIVILLDCLRAMTILFSNYILRQNYKELSPAELYYEVFAAIKTYTLIFTQL